MLKRLVRLANHLDEIGLRKEADYLDRVITNASADKMVEDGVLDGDEMIELGEKLNQNKDTPDSSDLDFEQEANNGLTVNFDGKIKWEPGEEHYRENHPWGNYTGEFSNFAKGVVWKIESGMTIIINEDQLNSVLDSYFSIFPDEEEWVSSILSVNPDATDDDKTVAVTTDWDKPRRKRV